MIQQAIGAKNTGAGKVDIGDQVAAIMAEARGQSPSTTTMTTDTASSVAGGADLGDQVVALMAAKRGKALENSQ
jgi:hypothetical protein